MRTLDHCIEEEYLLNQAAGHRKIYDNLEHFSNHILHTLVNTAGLNFK